MSDEATDGRVVQTGDRSLPVTAEFPHDREGGNALDLASRVGSLERHLHVMCDQLKIMTDMLEARLPAQGTQAYSAQATGATNESIRQGQGDSETTSGTEFAMFAAQDDVKAIVKAIVKGEQMRDDFCWKRLKESQPDTTANTEVPHGLDDGQGAFGSDGFRRRGRATCPFYLAEPNEDSAKGSESLNTLETLLRAGRPGTDVTAGERVLLEKMVNNSWRVSELYFRAMRHDPLQLVNHLNRLPVSEGPEHTGCQHSEFPFGTCVEILGGDQHLDGFDADDRLPGTYVVAHAHVVCQGGASCQCDANHIQVMTSHRYQRYRTRQQQPSTNAASGADPSLPGTSQTPVQEKYKNHELQEVTPSADFNPDDMPGADVIQDPGTPYSWLLPLVRRDDLADWRRGRGQAW